jgi:hypothetical protein
VNREEVLEELAERFTKLGAPPNVRHLLLEQHRRLLSIYDTYVTWSHSTGVKFKLGYVRWSDGVLVADVYLIGAGIEVKAAVICYDP